MRIDASFEPHVMDDVSVKRTVVIQRNGIEAARFPLEYRSGKQRIVFDFPQDEARSSVRSHIEVYLE